MWENTVTMFAYKYLKKYVGRTINLYLFHLVSWAFPQLSLRQKFPMSWVGIQWLVKAPAVQGKLIKSSGTPKE